MPIRFSKSGSSFRSGATALVATAGLWFSSAVYAQSQPAFETDTTPSSVQMQRQSFNQHAQQFNQLPASNSSRLQPQNFTTGRREYHPNPAPTTTQRLDLNQHTRQSVQRLIQNSADTAQNTYVQPSQGRGVVSDSIRTAPSQVTGIVSQLTESRSAQPSVARVSHIEPTAEAHSGVHQLTSVSMTVFEQKLVDYFGDRLQATTSGDGRFVRVTIPFQSTQNAAADPMAMLIDRKIGKLQYVGAAALTAQWHQLMSQLDSTGPATARPVAKADLQAEVTSLPQVQQVAFQQQFDDPNNGNQNNGNQNKGTRVQNVPGLSGPVYISQDSNGSLVITGAPEDVAKVKREIARLSNEAQAAQPLPSTIPLVNARGNLIQESVQQVYDASYAAINGPATITATNNPNGLVVVGSPKAIEAVRLLVRELDRKVDDTQPKNFRTFRLKFISSTDAANRLRTFFGQVTFSTGDSRLPETPVEIIPDFRSNQVTIKGSQAILIAAESYLSTIDVESVEGGAVNEVRVIRLKNALASDIAIVIQNAINGQLANAGQAVAPQALNQQQQQNQNVTDTGGTQSQLRSAMLSFMTRNEQGDFIKSGILFDVRITADFNTNSLIVTGPTQTIPLIEELVRQLDRLPEAESELKVFSLIHSDAQTIFDMLNSLFGQAQNAGGQQGGVGGGTAAGGVSSLPLQTGGGSDGATLINLRFSIEPLSNSIIAAGPARDLQVIEDLLNRLDARAINDSPARTYRLSNAPAQDVADAINSYLDSRTALIDSDPRTNAGVAAVNRSVIVVPEVVSNSLIVRATPEYRPEIEDIILSLDRRPPMIQVEVLIAQVDLNAVEEFGVELGIQDSLLFDRGTSIAADGSVSGIGFPFNTSTIPNANAVGRESLPAQALSNLNVGRINSSLGFGGLVLSAGNESLSILLRALKNRQCVKVLSKPQIMTLENLEGRVSIGASVARISGTNTTNFGLTQNITFEDVGVILEVVPRVSPDGLIVLSVNAESSSVGPEATGTAVGVGADGTIIRAQQILKTEATTTLSARSGQTVVFSGLITETKSHTERGVPILSDLPAVGPLFKFESDTSARSELLIIMTPTLVTDDSDLTKVNYEATNRIHWCEKDVREIFGSTGSGAEIHMGQEVDTYYPDADPTGMMQPFIHNSRLENPNQPTLGGNGEIISQPMMQTVSEAPPQMAPAPADRAAGKPKWKRVFRR